MQGVPSDEAERVPAQDGPEQVAQVAPGVWRIPVPLPFALKSANIYLIDDGPGQRVLIDSGLGLPADEQALRAGLAAAGVALENLSAFILTHAHPDHIGLSGIIHAAARLPIYMLEGEDKQISAVWGEASAPLQTKLDEMYQVNGMPDEIRAGSQKAGLALRRILHLPPADSITTLSDGQRLELGNHSYEVIWTPGHSDHHLCLLRDDGLFIAGDHILPHITPNIGLYVGARPDPLADYFSALRRVEPLPAGLVLPGHGRPFEGLAERAVGLRAHHDERSQFVYDIVSTERDGLNAYGVAGRLFGERLRSVDDWRFAVAETLAHLEYLRLAGHLERAAQDGVLTYSA
jgi:glyoxylase-like metal-dependent hydrolase (beta-lactamase superfamily II)